MKGTGCWECQAWRDDAIQTAWRRPGRGTCGSERGCQRDGRLHQTHQLLIGCLVDAVSVNGTRGAHRRTAPFQMILIALNRLVSVPHAPVDTPPPRNPYSPRTRWPFGAFTGKQRARHSDVSMNTAPQRHRRGGRAACDEIQTSRRPSQIRRHLPGCAVRTRPHHHSWRGGNPDSHPAHPPPRAPF